MTVSYIILLADNLFLNDVFDDESRIIDYLVNEANVLDNAQATDLVNSKLNGEEIVWDTPKLVEHTCK